MKHGAVTITLETFAWQTFAVRHNTLLPQQLLQRRKYFIFKILRSICSKPWFDTSNRLEMLFQTEKFH